MNQHAVVNKFSHVKPGDTAYKGGGLRDFFLYRDLGIAGATNGKVIAHLVKANHAAHRRHRLALSRLRFPDRDHDEGLGPFMYEDKVTLVEAGDVVHQRPGMVHYLFDYSPDMEYLEIVCPPISARVDMPPATDTVPPVTPWK